MQSIRLYSLGQTDLKLFPNLFMLCNLISVTDRNSGKVIISMLG